MPDGPASRSNFGLIRIKTGYFLGELIRAALTQPEALNLTPKPHLAPITCHPIKTVGIRVRSPKNVL